MPLYFFPDSSFEYIQQITEKNKSRIRALQAAQKKWNGSDFQRGEAEDPYYELCFSKIDSSAIFNQNFEQTAERIFGPIMAYSSSFTF